MEGRRGADGGVKREGAGGGVEEGRGQMVVWKGGGGRWWWGREEGADGGCRGWGRRCLLQQGGLRVGANNVYNNSRVAKGVSFTIPTHSYLCK